LLVREDGDAWRAFMCTNLSATAKEILEAVSDRSAIEQNFHDLKEIEGVGQQQVRNFCVTGRLKYHQYGRVQNQPVNFPFSYIVLS